MQSNSLRWPTEYQIKRGLTLKQFQQEFAHLLDENAQLTIEERKHIRRQERRIKNREYAKQQRQRRDIMIDNLIRENLHLKRQVKALSAELETNAQISIDLAPHPDWWTFFENQQDRTLAYDI